MKATGRDIDSIRQERRENLAQQAAENKKAEAKEGSATGDKTTKTTTEAGNVDAKTKSIAENLGISAAEAKRYEDVGVDLSKMTKEQFMIGRRR